MITRLAKEEDLQAIYQLGFASYSEEAVKDYGAIINKEKARQTVSALVKQQSVFVAVEDNKIVGAMIGSVSTSMFSDDWIFASIYFFMAKEFRVHVFYFISEIEKILKQNNITKFIIGNPEFNSPEKMDRFYRLLGFRRLETHYIRSL